MASIGESKTSPTRTIQTIFICSFWITAMNKRKLPHSSAKKNIAVIGRIIHHTRRVRS